MPTHRWILFGLLTLGLVDGAFGILPTSWRLVAIGLFALGAWWQFSRRRSFAGEDDMFGSDRSDERKRYARTILGDHVAVAQSVRVAKARTRSALIWLPSAYLVGLVLAFLVL